MSSPWPQKLWSSAGRQEDSTPRDYVSHATPNALRGLPQSTNHVSKEGASSINDFIDRAAFRSALGLTPGRSFDATAISPEGLTQYINATTDTGFDWNLTKDGDFTTRDLSSESSNDATIVPHDNKSIGSSLEANAASSEKSFGSLANKRNESRGSPGSLANTRDESWGSFVDSGHALSFGSTSATYLLDCTGGWIFQGSDETYAEEIRIGDLENEDLSQRAITEKSSPLSSTMSSGRLSEPYRPSILPSRTTMLFLPGKPLLDSLNVNSVPSLTADQTSRDGDSPTSYETPVTRKNSEIADTIQHLTRESLFHQSRIPRNLDNQPTSFSSRNPTREIPDLSLDQLSVGEEVEEDENLEDMDSEISDSFWWSDYSERTPMLENDHPLLLGYLKLLIQDLLREYRAWLLQAQNGSLTDNGEAAGSTSSVNNTTVAASGASEKGPSKDAPAKRRNVSDENDDGDDEVQPPPRKKKITMTDDKPRSLLACPFCKRDPVRWKSCFGYIFKKISHMKQHLSRIHGPPIYCPDCWKVFDNEKDRNKHTRARSCEQQPEVQFDCVSEDQKKKLQKRVDAKLSEEEQWFSIFEILFPKHPLPTSAYLDPTLSEQFRAFREFETIHGPGIIITRLDNMDNSVSMDEWMALREIAVREALLEILDEWKRRQNSTTDVPIGSIGPSAADPRSSSRTSFDTLVEDVSADHLGDSVGHPQDESFAGFEAAATEPLEAQEFGGGTMNQTSAAANEVTMSEKGFFSHENLDPALFGY